MLYTILEHHFVSALVDDFTSYDGLTMCLLGQTISHNCSTQVETPSLRDIVRGNLMSVFCLNNMFCLLYYHTHSKVTIL